MIASSVLPGSLVTSATPFSGGENVKIAAHNVVYLRKEPRPNAEQVSQALLGSRVKVLQTEEAWSYIETDDGYRGWSQSRWLIEPDGRDWTQITSVFSELRAEPHSGAPLVARLTILNGVHVESRDASGWVAVQLPGGGMYGYLPAADLAPLPAIPAGEIGVHAAATGRQFLGTPYLWGGSSSYGLDCSGFVQICYRLSGITLRRDADIQRDDPRFVPVERKDMLPGDLIFFGRPDRITHIGMFFVHSTQPDMPDHFIHSAGGQGVNIAEVGREEHWPRFVDVRRLDPAKAGEPVSRAPEPPYRSVLENN